MKSTQTTLVIGASENPERYSNKAIKSLLNSEIKVYALAQRAGSVNGVVFDTTPMLYSEIDTITLYISPSKQIAYYDYIISLNPRRVIFNPGTENDEFAKLLHSNNIEVVEACTLVMLSIGVY